MPDQIKPVYREISDTLLSVEKFNRILCPNLRVGVRMGLLNPDSDGWVTTEEVEAFLEYVGIKADSYIEKMLVYLGKTVTTETRPDYMNITEFQDTMLDHGSSSGILNNVAGFSEERLAYLKSLSSDGRTLTQADLAVAANCFFKHPAKCRSVKGTGIESLELSSLFAVYGTKKKDKAHFFTFEDVDNLWKFSRFPKGWQENRIWRYGTWRAIKDMMCLVFKRIFGRSA